MEKELLSTLTQNQLTLILHDICENRIGITGYELFTVTYSTTAQVKYRALKSKHTTYNHHL